MTGDLAGTLTEVRPGRSLSVAVAPDRADSDLVIFLCHGAGGSKHQWRHIWAGLIGDGHRVIAWDAMGHGESPQPRRRAAYRGEAFLADYRNLLERHGAARNLLIGHSYGTRLTLALLEQLAREGQLAHIAAAALLGPPPVGVKLGGGSIAWLPAFVLEWMRPSLSRGFRERAWHPATDAALIDAEEAATRRNSLFMMKALMTQAIAVDPAGLATLDLPVLVLAGEADRLTPPAGAEDLARRLKRADYHLITGSGHQIMLEQPAETLRLLRALIATL
jgi:pimeloyl-ACP methyl ester carboxylesterase